MKLAKQREEQYYNKHGCYYYGNHPREIIEEMFNWLETTEGHKFWNEISSGRYELFYDKYPEKRIKSTYEIY